MDIKLLRTFVAVAENKHFGKAAEQVFITQAAVSARIKQLEDIYQTQLIIRDKNSLKLTSAGEALLVHSFLLIEQFESSRHAVAVASNQKVTFQIAATPNIWDAFLNSRLSQITTLFQQNIITAEISSRESIQRKLEEKVVNVGFLADPIKDDGFVNIEIGYFDVALMGTKAEFDPEKDNYIFVDWGIKFIKEHALVHQVIPTLKTSTASIALEWITNQDGFAYLPVNSAQALIKKNKLFVISSSLTLQRPIFMVYKKSGINLDLIQALSSKLKD